MPQFMVTVGGDIAPITRSLQELNSDLRNFRNQLQTATDPVSVAILNQQLRETEEEIRRIRGIGPILPPDSTRGLNSATQSLTNIGRVAQDLPFGFIGIANNLNPLLEGFQRLRAETGSGRAALQALGSSLLGAGGIGVALSLVTAGLSFMQLGLQAWGVKTEKAKNDLEEFIKTLKNSNAVIDEATGSQAGAIAKVEALANVITNTNNAYAERKRALEELKETNKNYFGDLTLEANQLSLVTQRVNEYTQALTAQAVVKGFTDEISRVSVEFAKQDRVLRQNTDEVNRLRGKLETMRQSETSLTGEDRISEKYLRTKKALSAANDAFAAQSKTVTTLKGDLNALNTSLEDAVRETLKFRDIDAPKEEKHKKEEDALKKRLAVLERIKKVTSDVNDLVDLQEAIFDLQVKIAIRDDKKRLDPREFTQLIGGFQKELNEAFLNQALALEAIPKIKVVPVIDKLDFNDIIKRSFTTKITPVEITDQFGIALKPTVESIDVTDLKGRVDKAVGLQKINVTLHDVRVKLLGGRRTKLIEDTEDLNKQLTEEINSSLLNLRVDLAGTLGESLGEAFANAITGQDIGEGLKNAAKQMLSILGSVMQQIGKYVIAAAIKIEALKKAISTWAVKNPALAIIAGIGLVAAGAALKNVTFDGPKFAKGGIVTGPTIGLVGEAGREAIIPLNRLPEMIGGRGQTNVVVKGSLSIRGRELVALLEQETSRFNRLV